MTHSVKEKFRKDYQPSSHLIDIIDLYFDLSEEVTTVTAKMSVRKNPASSEMGDVMVLNGLDQKLIYVKINDKEILSRQYELTDETLTLLGLPESFTLEIQSEIKPQDNTVLMGLYKSNGIYCTQCESEGFRRMIYHPDRPDILSKFTTTISADKSRYPVLLSNGNLVGSGDLADGRHWIKWEDPFLKPNYLFALVAGDLDFIEDNFTTMSDRNITLRLFFEKGNKEKVTYAMHALKQAMKWDEEHYGREYDLDLFMILAVDDFNVGAMENKGLNIFNTKCIYAKSDTTTDVEYARVACVVAHEYFHNWTGDRVTCRDWFQLSLKEGLTVFRDQSFSEDITSPSTARIAQIQRLRDLQFPEDAGPLAHPIRPDSYMEIDNFYTMTVYEKGAEVIRMMRTLLGKEGFRRGMDLYFERHDGQAVTCDDYVKALEDANHFDLSQFRLWYSQAGTPTLTVETLYDEKAKEFTFTIKQFVPPTPKQPTKQPMHIPVAVALLDSKGQEIPLRLKGEKGDAKSTFVLELKEEEQTFVFIDVSEEPIPSLLRHFSAPVTLNYAYTDEELSFLMEHDADPFARWEAGQRYCIRVIRTLVEAVQNKHSLQLPAAFVESFRAVLNDDVDDELVAQMFQLPTETYLSELFDPVDVDSLFVAREFVYQNLAEQLKEDFVRHYAKRSGKPYGYTVKEVGARSLKNTCLHYLMYLNDASILRHCLSQFQEADNMTDRFAALTALANTDCKERLPVLEQFYEMFKTDLLVVDKWLMVQAMSKLPDTFNRVKALLKHPAFNIKNPNRVRSLLVGFSKMNFVRFHAKSGDGYRFLADQVLVLDKINPHMSARLLDPLTHWRRYDAARQALMCAELKRVLNTAGLSKNAYEIASKSLEEGA